MKSVFRMSAAAMAVMVATTAASYAGHATHGKYKHRSLKGDYKADTTVLLHDEARADFQFDPTAPILPTNHSQFLNWVEDINGGKSTQHQFKCWNNTVCFSGLLDMDVLYYNRKGSPIGNTASTAAGAGVRPLFGGVSTSQVVGSINNANAFVDLLVGEYVRIHSNIAYVNGSVKEDSYAWNAEADWGDVFRVASSIKADELYVVFSDPAHYPAYLKVGRMYLDFGNYQPNGYGLPTIVPSLTQLLTQTRTGGAQLGFGLNNGMYGSATWSMAQQSLLGFNNNSRNYSAKLGYMHQFKNMFLKYVDASASFLWDLRDADYINGTLYLLKKHWVRVFNEGSPAVFSSKRQSAVAVNASTKFGSSSQFGVGVEGVTALGPMNRDGIQSRVWAAGVNANYSFPTFGHDSSLAASYQASRNSRYIQGAGTIAGAPATGLGVGPFSYQLPKRRVDLTYIVSVIPHVNAALEWVRDWDFKRPRGFNQYSDFGVFRIDVQF